MNFKTLLVFAVILIDCTVGFGYLSPYDPDYDRKLIYQRNNIARVEKILEEIRRDPHKYSFRTAMHFMSQTSKIDMSRPDALDDVRLLTKNSLYRYRVNRAVLESVQYKIKRVNKKSWRIYEASNEFASKLKRKLNKIIGSSWRRSYIVTNAEIRPPITFS